MNDSGEVIVVPGVIDTTAVPFSLFSMSSGGNRETIVEKGDSFDRSVLISRRRSGHTFLVPSTDEADFHRHTFPKLDGTISSRELNLVDKAKFLHCVVKGYFDRVRANPREQSVLSESMLIVITTLKFIINSPKDISLLLARCGRESYFYTHNINVCILNIMIGQKKYGRDIDALLKIGQAGLLHDIGKMAIPLDLLQKTEQLTKEELAELRRHVTYGYSLLKQLHADEFLQKVAMEHHERNDGSGYPTGKTGPQIDIMSQITTVSDVFDAATSEKGYGSYKAKEDILREFVAEKSKYGTSSLKALFEIVLNKR